jgi:hypothetical protein
MPLCVMLVHSAKQMLLFTPDILHSLVSKILTYSSHSPSFQWASEGTQHVWFVNFDPLLAISYRIYFSTALSPTFLRMVSSTK